MKIALCISGYFNSFTDLESKGIDGFAHIKKHILDKHNDVDVYIHSWDVVNKDLIKSLYKKWLVTSKFELQMSFDEIIFQNKLNSFFGARPVSSIFSHLYSTQEAYKLVYNSPKKYDLVFGTRFDVGRINRRTSGPGRGNPYPVQCINFQTDIEKDKIYMANWQYFKTEGPCPFWLYGSYTVMNPFCGIYDFAKNEFKPNSEYEQMCGTNDGGMINVVKLYKWFMIKNKLWENRINLETVWE